MFGNVQGWCISAVLVLATGGLIVWKGMPQIPTGMKPTGTLKPLLESAALSTDPRTVVPLGTADGDGGKLFRDAAATFNSNRDAYDRAKRSAVGITNNAQATKAQQRVTDAAQALLPVLDTLIAAGKCKTITFFAANPGEVVNYTPFDRKPLLPVLQDMGNFALEQSVQIAQTDKERAADIRRAVFHMGRVLYEERPSWPSYEVALKLMRDSSFRLRTTISDEGEKTKLANFSGLCETQLGKTVQLTQDGFYQFPKEGQLWPRTGDVMDLAQNSKDPVWQAQALLRLGVLKGMNGVDSTNQQVAEQIIDLYVEKADAPANVRAAAKAAKNITTMERQLTNNIY